MSSLGFVVLALGGSLTPPPRPSMLSDSVYTPFPHRRKLDKVKRKSYAPLCGDP